MKQLVEWLSGFGRPKRLGERLCQQGLITQEQLESALLRQRKRGRRLGHNLIEMEFLEAEVLASFLADTYRVPSVLLHPEMVDDKAASILPLDFLSKMEILPISQTEKSVTVAMLDPSDQALVEKVSQHLNKQVNPVVVPQFSLLDAIENLKLKKELESCFRNESQPERDRLSALFARLRDYHVLGSLGKGGFAKVFKCLQKSLDRLVAVKTLDLDQVSNEEVIACFKREGKIAARLNHPNIVRMIDQGQIENTLYLVMEYVEGLPLNEYLGSKSFDIRLDAFIQICDSLAYAHSKGVIHRDIKPANILVDESGMTHLLDFGIAIYQSSDGESDVGDIPDVIMGTPRYMAPEQQEGSEFIDGRADLYSIGVMMFEIFGDPRQTPNHEVNLHELNPDIPAPFAKALQRCLAPSPAQRLSGVKILKEFLLQLRSKIFGTEDLTGQGTQQTSSPERMVKERYEFLSDLKIDKHCQVVLAEHKTLKRMVIIRTMDCKEGLDENRILSRFSHPNIMPVLGVSENAGGYLVVREYWTHGTLADRMKGYPKYKIQQIVHYLLDVAEGLDFAHEYHVAHGHLHPGNLLFDAAGNLRISDFACPSSCEKPMTRYFDIPYRDVSSRDRFAIGVMLFEMLACRAYFPSRGPDENFEDLKGMDIESQELLYILRKLWGMVPAKQRYTDYKGLIEDLQQLLPDLPFEGDTLAGMGGGSHSGRSSKNLASIPEPQEVPIMAALIIFLILAGVVGLVVWFFMR